MKGLEVRLLRLLLGDELLLMNDLLLIGDLLSGVRLSSLALSLNG